MPQELQSADPTPRHRRWRSYSARAAREIDRALFRAGLPSCPGCGGTLRPRAASRTEQLILDAVGYDLECGSCYRFRSIVVHTTRSLRLLRMRRLVAAVKSIGNDSFPPPVGVSSFRFPEG